jgi:AcrR family transcriptional regulator
MADNHRLPPGPGLPSQEVAAHQLARIHRAMIEIVAEEGYKSVKVRDVVGRAEVSTRAFYEHFSSKEDCFLRTFELVARRATQRLIAAQAGERDWRQRVALVFEAFLQELAEDPHGARFALVEARLGGQACLEQAWRAERIFEGMLTECFARVPKGIVVPPLIIEGMVAGIGGVSRNCLLPGRVGELHDASGDLIAWALGYPAQGAAKLAELDRQHVWRDTTLEPRAMARATAGEAPWSTSGDRSLILEAVAKLSVKSGYSGLTASRIRASAGVSRKKFNSHFDDVEDCYLATLEMRAAGALTQSARAQAAASSPAGAVYRAIAALCGHIAGDSFLSRVCRADDFPPGPEGARSRKRLTGAMREQLKVGAPRGKRQPRLSADATDAAAWSLFHHHIIRNRSKHHEISATLSYLVLAPLIGAQEAVEAVKSEQSG